MSFSLRHYLLGSILLTTALIGGLTIWGSYRVSVNEVNELFDAQLSRSALLILGLAMAEVDLGHMEEFTDNVLDYISPRGAPQGSPEDSPVGSPVSRPQGPQRGPQLGKSPSTSPDTKINKQLIEQVVYQQGHFYELKLAYQVWDSYGNMLLRSESAPLQPMSELSSGYAEQTVQQQHWRTYSLWDADQTYQVITAERGDVRNELVRKITLQLTWPFVLLLPMIGVLVWYFVGQALVPLNAITSEISRRKKQVLEPLQFERVPVEIQPLMDELNHLFVSLRESFEKERRFTSDAAHELRTPLAVIKTHLQLLESAQTEQDKAAALGAIHQGVERSGHLVDQLLGLARLEPQAIRGMQKMEKLDLHALCAEAIADIYPLAREKNQQISLQGDQQVSIQGFRYPLQSMLQNLLGNSVSYTPLAGEIILELRQEKNALHIWLHDSGPGIPPEQRQAVLQRFRKVEGVSHTGSGIGLSIVKRVAELHDMQLELVDSSRLGGLCVHLLQLQNLPGKT